MTGKSRDTAESLMSYKHKGFIIHGHDKVNKLEVARIIEKETGKKAIILHEMPSRGKTIIEKFEKHSDADFAVALWTSDDLGKAKNDKELQKRARQNVIFETGYFIGRLGRDKVIILYESGVEKPSDYDGVVYIALSDNWKYELIKEIKSIYE
jgi:predicted nucleotide-binding protein